MNPPRGVNPPFISSSRSHNCLWESVTDGRSIERFFNSSASSPAAMSGVNEARVGIASMVTRGLGDAGRWSGGGIIGIGARRLQPGRVPGPGRTGDLFAKGCVEPGCRLARHTSVLYPRPAGLYTTAADRVRHGETAHRLHVRAVRCEHPAVAGPVPPTAERGTRSRKASRRPAGRVCGRRRRPAGPSRRRAWTSPRTRGLKRTWRSSTGCSAGGSWRERWCSSAESPGSANRPCCCKCWPASLAAPAPLPHGPST